jgi:hypothetical protein
LNLTTQLLPLVSQLSQSLGCGGDLKREVEITGHVEVFAEDSKEPLGVHSCQKKVVYHRHP